MIITFKHYSFKNKFEFFARAKIKKIDFSSNKISNVQIMHKNNAFNNFSLMIAFQSRKTKINTTILQNIKK